VVEGARLSGQDRPDIVQALVRGFRVVGSFDEEHVEQSITEIADRTGIPKGSVQRILVTLAELGYAECIRDRWMLTPAIMDFGVAYVASRGVYAAAYAHMARLAAETDQIVSLLQLSGSDVVFMLRVDSMKHLTTGITVGSRLPAVHTAAGRVLLSHLPDDELRRALATPPRSTYRAPTELDSSDLRAELALTRERGWAFSDESALFSVRALSAPVTDHEGRVVAGVSMTVSVLEMSADEMIERFRLPILETARRCSDDWARIHQLPIGPNGTSDDQIRIQTVLRT
jgi:IclR family pca regulon transcriptional regulator